jgi:hypothetical protein
MSDVKIGLTPSDVNPNQLDQRPSTQAFNALKAPDTFITTRMVMMAQIMWSQDSQTHDGVPLLRLRILKLVQDNQVGGPDPRAAYQALGVFFY